jgi:DNA-binding MarR family transcriptional regulator
MPASDKDGPGIDERLMMAIVRVSERFKRKSSAIFADYGISFSQYNVLRLLNGCKGGQSTITEISRQLIVSTPNMSGIAKRLEKSGFVNRSRDKNDERKTILILKAPGRQVLAKIRNLQEKNIEKFLTTCPIERKRVIMDLLRDMLKRDI